MKIHCSDKPSVIKKEGRTSRTPDKEERSALFPVSGAVVDCLADDPAPAHKLFTAFKFSTAATNIRVRLATGSENYRVQKELAMKDLIKGLEKDIKKEIEQGLEEELRCECGHKVTEALRRLKDNPTLVCPVCGLETVVSIRVKKGP